MRSMRGGGASRPKRMKRLWLRPAPGHSMEAQGAPNHPPNDEAHLHVSQMPGGDDPPVARHSINHTIEVLPVTHVSGSTL